MQEGIRIIIMKSVVKYNYYKERVEGYVQGKREAGHLLGPFERIRSVHLELFLRVSQGNGG